MKQDREPTPPKDTPATRRRRLQQRLREINDRNEKELGALMKSVDRLKSTFRSKKNKQSRTNQ